MAITIPKDLRFADTPGLDAVLQSLRAEGMPVNKGYRANDAGVLVPQFELPSGYNTGAGTLGDLLTKNPEFKLSDGTDLLTLAPDTLVDKYLSLTSIEAERKVSQLKRGMQRTIEGIVDSITDETLQFEADGKIKVSSRSESASAVANYLIKSWLLLDDPEAGDSKITEKRMTDYLQKTGIGRHIEGRGYEATQAGLVKYLAENEIGMERTELLGHMIGLVSKDSTMVKRDEDIGKLRTQMGKDQKYQPVLLGKVSSLIGETPQGFDPPVASILSAHNNWVADQRAKPMSGPKTYYQKP